MDMMMNHQSSPFIGTILTRFEEFLKWTIFTLSMTRCTLNCIRGFHTRLWVFFHFLKTSSKTVRPKNHIMIT